MFLINTLQLVRKIRYSPTGGGDVTDYDHDLNSYLQWSKNKNIIVSFYRVYGYNNLLSRIISHSYQSSTNSLFQVDDALQYSFFNEVHIPTRVLLLVSKFFLKFRYKSSIVGKLHEADLLLVRSIIFVSTFTKSCF